MKPLTLVIPVLLSFSVFACGRQLVELPRDDRSWRGDNEDSGDDDTDNGGQGPTGTTNDAPLVITVLPVNAASAVSSNTRITATFNEPMNPATITAASFTLQQGETPITGTVVYDATTSTATFTPIAALDPSSVYTATLQTSATDTNGRGLSVAYDWSFTTAVNAAAPMVAITTPLNLSPNVSIGTAITATFSKAMDPATVNAFTFTVAQGATAVTGVVTLDGATNTATFTPSTALVFNTLTVATISAAVEDTAGNAMEASYSWSFVTAQTTAPPMITNTLPGDLAMNVSLGKTPRATFSKAMDPATINSLTFSLQQGTTSIPGAVTFDGESNTAAFTPFIRLGAGLTYTATITTGAMDTAHLPLAADFSWTFTLSACGQAPIELLSADRFAILAGSTITNTGGSEITGDIGLSPGTAITGFGAATIVGVQYLGDPVAAQAIADLGTAYNDAAGRTLCAVSKIGELGGQVLLPGLYKSTSDMAITSAPLTLDGGGDEDAVFIFQIATTLTTTSGRDVLLVNGAKAANVFWKVGSDATIGSSTDFHGTIMADQSITLVSGASLTGRALARVAAVTLDDNTITTP